MKCRLVACVALLGGLALVAVQPSLSQQAAGGKKIKVTVTLPQADSKLTIDGNAVKGKGEKRTTTVTVPAGKEEIVVKAVWEPNNYTKITRTRKVAAKGARVPGKGKLKPLADAPGDYVKTR